MKKLLLTAAVVFTAMVHAHAEGCHVNEVLAGSPAQQAGLKVGDTILAANGATITTHQDIASAVRATASDLRLIVRRDKKTEEMTVRLETPKSDKARLGVGCRYDSEVEEAGDFRLLPRHSLSLGLGGAFPAAKLDMEDFNGRKEKIGESGLHVGARYLFSTGPRTDIGLEVNHQAPSVHRFEVGPSIEELSMRSTVVMAVFTWHKPRRGKASPYLLSGIGFHVSEFTWDIEPGPGYVWYSSGPRKRSLVSDRETGVAVMLGFGLDYDITPTVFLAAEARADILGARAYKATDFGSSAGIVKVDAGGANGTLLARVGIRFGTGSEKAPASPAPAPSFQTEPLPTSKSPSDAAM